VARILGLKPRAVYNMIRDGELTAYKFRNRIRVRKHDLDILIEEAQI
jgi:excisionase family DNA binding protein